MDEDANVTRQNCQEDTYRQNQILVQDRQVKEDQQRQERHEAAHPGHLGLPEAEASKPKEGHTWLGPYGKAQSPIVLRC